MAPQKIQVRMVDQVAREFVCHLLQEHGFRVAEQTAYQVGLSGGGQDGVVASDIVSPTETRVLQALADCGTTEGAAGVCRVAPCTVKKHVENLFGKLGVHTRVQLVAEGFRLGILR
ncbi:MAG: helix-turn-helix transcriptional regulator [Armatimonadetes bacterium]|nr:helix-turn-helix transcriptional regulator [Armatimonadota bacterium]NCO94963.1 helix-turn-helix transcriptional regulator [Armatimonadota bacterium]NCP34526.1 helix-turn-helix transcriptional regulator [Armatimonadota bacterium]NDK16129.1 helix-turn-helix transcriptional regulator [Armatimonadota bacterium]